MSQASKRPRRNEPSPPGQPEEVTEETNVIYLTMDDDFMSEEEEVPPAEEAIGDPPIVPPQDDRTDLLFTRQKVTNWRTALRKAWKDRRTNPEHFYYRFKQFEERVMIGQSWTRLEHNEFMIRYNAWIDQNIQFQGNWGWFSREFPFRTRKQCREHSDVLVKHGVLMDRSGMQGVTPEKQFEGWTAEQEDLVEDWLRGARPCQR